jgi:hypothetical protein
MNETAVTDNPDHRIFGFDEQNRLRANLHNGPGHCEAGVKYSWVVADTARQLASKLEQRWEEPVTEDEWHCIEALERHYTPEREAALPFSEFVEVQCEDCGGRGGDSDDPSVGYVGSECPTCCGSGTVMVLRQYLAEAFAIVAGQSTKPAQAEHLTALASYARAVVNCYMTQRAA